MSQKTIREVIDENNESVKEWINEGKFDCHAEMVFAQSLSQIIEAYEKRRNIKGGKTSDS